ncbi:MAG: hypothetical protein MRY59_07400 [Aquisalinus sp.]|nr:hypothetical protein [Aquisalinus sp.]
MNFKLELQGRADNQISRTALTLMISNCVLIITNDDAAYYSSMSLSSSLETIRYREATIDTTAATKKIILFPYSAGSKKNKMLFVNSKYPIAFVSIFLMPPPPELKDFERTISVSSKGA